MMKINYQIAVTYRCNQKCRYCCEHFDRLPCLGLESDVTAKDVAESGRRLHDVGIQVDKIGFTGGEPLLHTDLRAIKAAVVQHWHPLRKVHIFTSGFQEPLYTGYVRGVRAKTQKQKHHPIMISPADLGLEPLDGFTEERPCWAQTHCGRYFDAYGFSACPAAAPLGRLLGIDVHYATPVLTADRELCKHCLHSLGKRQMQKLSVEAMQDKFEHPTWTYRVMIFRRLAEGYVRFPKFLER